MTYCIEKHKGYIIGPFSNIESATKYVESDSELNISMIQVMQEPAY